MKPLSDVPDGAWSSVVGVAFDVDDTVTRDGRLELSAFRAMHELRAAGVHLIAATGRPLGWADVVAQHWPVDAAVGENGAGWVWHDGTRLREGYAEPEEARRSYRELFDRVRRRVREEMPHVRLTPDQRARRCDLAFDVGDTVRLPRTDVERLVALIESEGARAAVSTVHAHAVPGPWDKARGIAGAARDALEIDLASGPDRWVFVGDSGNDAEAFAFFPLSVGVANIAEIADRLSIRPAFLASRERGDGFAEVARHVLAGR